MSDVTTTLGDVSPFREPDDQRDRWSRGRVRHLRVTEDAPRRKVLAFRARYRDADDGHDVLYTLAVHPDNVADVEQLRALAEPAIGGFFSPPPDLSAA